MIPNKDLFEKMTNNQMAYFKSKLENLRDALEDAEEEADPVEACKTLQKHFGEDFQIPPKEETARAMPAAVVSSSSSA